MCHIVRVQGALLLQLPKRHLEGAESLDRLVLLHIPSLQCPFRPEAAEIVGEDYLSICLVRDQDFVELVQGQNFVAEARGCLVESECQATRSCNNSRSDDHVLWVS